ncbi:MAG: HEAT repeat domain-containing protein [Planctomycetota bacterium]
MRYILVLFFTAIIFSVSFAQESEKPEENESPKSEKIWIPPLEETEERFLDNVYVIDKCVTVKMRKEHIVHVGNLCEGNKGKFRKEILKEAVDKVSEHLRTEIDYSVRIVCPESITKIAIADTSGEITKTAVTELISALKKDKKNIVRAAAAAYLAELGDKDAGTALIEALQNDLWSVVRSVCVEAIDKLSIKDAVPVLREALANDAYSSVRAAAASALAKFEDTESINLFIKGLKDPFSSVRIACCKALEQVPSNEAFQSLSELTKDKHELVREAVAAPLGKIKTSESVAVLESMLDDVFEFVRESVIVSLAEIGTEEAKTLLAAKGLKDPNYNCKLKAISGLCNLKDERGYEAILNTLKDKYPFQRISAIELIKELNLNESKIIAALQEITKNDESEAVVVKAVEVLNELNKK